MNVGKANEPGQPLLSVSRVLRSGMKRALPGILLSCQAFCVAAAPPALESLFPCGARAGGQKTIITVTGKDLEKTKADVWCDHPGIVFKPTDKAKVYEVTVSSAVPPGPHLVRLFNTEGASLPHVFVIGKHDETTDTEPNDDDLTAQRVSSLPMTLHGKLEKSGDVDTFAVQLTKGRTFVADLQGYALGSQMDPAMKLLDAQGVEVAMSHDTFCLDPRLEYVVKEDGTYYVQLMAFAHPPAADVTLKGSAAHIYRLTVTEEAFAESATPCAVQRGSAAKVATAAGDVQLETSRSTAGERRMAVPTASGESVFVALVAPPVVMEEHPHDNPKSPQRLTLPFAVCGSVSPAGQMDRYIFTAKKGDLWTFRIHAASIHSPLDAALRIEDVKGVALQQNDDAGEGDADPLLKWKAPSDGDFVVAVSDLYQRGGQKFCYALEASAPSPTLAATLADHSIKISAGKSAELKVTIKPSGDFKGKLSARLAGLPQGITAKEAEAPAKGGELKIQLNADSQAPAASTAVEVLISTSAPDSPMTFKATYDLRGVEPRGDRLINEDTRVWLTVTPSPVKAAAPSAASSPPASPAPPAAPTAAKP